MAGYGLFLHSHRYYAGIVNYLKVTQYLAISYKFNYRDLLFMVIVDFPLSFLSLWLAIFVATGNKRINPKSYAWFLFIYNLTRFIAFIGFKILWAGLYAMLIRLEPSLKVPVFDAFSVYVIVNLVLIYIWLLARTFNLGALSAAKTFLVSHLLYCVVIVAAVFVFSLGANTSIIKKNAGFNPIVQSCTLDVNKITSGRNIFSFIRLRPFHL